MNINSISSTIKNDFFESVLDTLSFPQKKIMLIALGIFSAVALVYYFYRFCNFKTTLLTTDDANQPVDGKVSQKTLPLNSSAKKTKKFDIKPAEDLSDSPPIREEEANVVAAEDLADSPPITEEVADVVAVEDLADSPKTKELENNFSLLLKDGRTKKILRDGTIEIGEFEDEKLEGEGLRLFPDEHILEADELAKIDPYPKGHKGIKQVKGTFKEGKLHGEGEILFFNGAEYKGTFANDLLVQGRKEYSKVSSSKIDYENGRFENDKLQGKGKIRLKDGKIIQGIFEEGIQIEEKDVDYQIFIKTPTGTILTLSTSFDQTIADIKEAISKKEGTAINQMRLIFAGRQPEDDQTLEELKIKKESTIHLVLRLGGD